MKHDRKFFLTNGLFTRAAQIPGLLSLYHTMNRFIADTITFTSEMKHFNDQSRILAAIDATCLSGD
jgi:hypothetical protein